MGKLGGLDHNIEGIINEVQEHFDMAFTSYNPEQNNELLDCIPSQITTVMNIKLEKRNSAEEMIENNVLVHLWQV